MTAVLSGYGQESPNVEALYASGLASPIRSVPVGGLFYADNVEVVTPDTPLYVGNIVAFELVGDEAQWNWSVGTITSISGPKANLLSVNEWTVDSSETLPEVKENRSEISRAREALKEANRSLEDLQTQSKSMRLGELEQALLRSQSLLDAARAAIQRVEQRHWDDLGAPLTPKAIVPKVVEAALTMIRVDASVDWLAPGTPKERWAVLQRCVCQPSFVRSILEFNFTQQPKTMRDHITRRFIADPTFRFEEAFTASRAAGPLQKWVVSQIRHYDAYHALAEAKREKLDLDQRAGEWELECQQLREVISQCTSAISASRRAITTNWSESRNSNLVFRQTGVVTTTLRSSVFCKLISCANAMGSVSVTEEELNVIFTFAKRSLAGAACLRSPTTSGACSPSAQGHRDVDHEQAADRHNIVVAELRSLYDQHVHYVVERQRLLENVLNAGSKHNPNLVHDLRHAQERLHTAEAALINECHEAAQARTASEEKIAELRAQLQRCAEREAEADRKLADLASQAANTAQTPSPAHAADSAVEAARLELSQASADYIAAVEMSIGKPDPDNIRIHRERVVDLSRKLEAAEKEALAAQDTSIADADEDIALRTARLEHQRAITKVNELLAKLQTVERSGKIESNAYEETMDRLRIALQEESEHSELAVAQVHEANEICAREICVRHGIDVENLGEEVHDTSHRYLSTMARLQEYLRESAPMTSDRDDRQATAPRHSLELPPGVARDLEEYREEARRRFPWLLKHGHMSESSAFTTPDEVEIVHLKELLEAERRETARVQALLSEAQQQLSEKNRLSGQRPISSHYLMQAAEVLEGSRAANNVETRPGESGAPTAAGPGTTQQESIVKAHVSAENSDEGHATHPSRTCDPQGRTTSPGSASETAISDSPRSTVPTVVCINQTPGNTAVVRNSESGESARTSMSAKTIHEASRPRSEHEEVTSGRETPDVERAGVSEAKREQERGLRSNGAHLADSNCASPDTARQSESPEMELHHTKRSRRKVFRRTRHSKRLPGKEWLTVIYAVPEALRDALATDAALACECPVESISNVKYRQSRSGLRASFNVVHSADVDTSQIEQLIQFAAFNWTWKLYPNQWIDVSQSAITGTERSVKSGGILTLVEESYDASGDEDREQLIPLDQASATPRRREQTRPLRSPDNRDSLEESPRTTPHARHTSDAVKQPSHRSRAAKLRGKSVESSVTASELRSIVAVVRVPRTRCDTLSTRSTPIPFEFFEAPRS